jgi:hypothetical protein
MAYNFNLMNMAYRKLYTKLKKTIIQITFYFVEEGPGRGSENTRKECNVNCFDVSFFPFRTL